MRATKSYCVPVLTYGFGIITWTKKEVEQFDVVTRKILTKNNSHHPRSSIERLYLPRSETGRGLINIENLFYRKLVLMAWHLSCSTDCLVQLCSDLDQSLPPRISIHSRAKSYCSSLSISSEFELCLVSNLKQTIYEKQVNSLLESLTAKPLHGKFFSSLRSPEIDV